jgi:hypothetical protein
MRRALVAWIAAAVFAQGFAAIAEDAPTAKAGDAAVGVEKGEAAGAADEGKKEYVFLTGLDFSYWAADEGPTIGGPGITVGFVLVPKHLEVDFALGAMMGGHQYTIPFEAAFTIPVYVTPWFAPYLKFGPTIITDKVKEETTYDFAVSMSLGIELVPVGYDWGLYLSGDYNVRTMQDVRHQGGFTVGFHYRI